MQGSLSTSNSHWASECMADLFYWFALCSKRGREGKLVHVLFWSMGKSTCTILALQLQPAYLVIDIPQTSLAGIFGINYQCL
jgi:hypothetical protein